MRTSHTAENDTAEAAAGRKGRIPAGSLADLPERSLPQPVPLGRMLGPGIILSGLALGSGEFILWPYLTYRSGFVFFWACILGLTIQYFLNMEIARWTLATGETAITGFVRMWRPWAWVFLFLNIVPWMVPAWARGAAQLLGWMIWGGGVDGVGPVLSEWITGASAAGLFLCGAVLTAGRVVYETVERIQFVLVGLILSIVIVLGLWLVRPDAISAQIAGMLSVGRLPPPDAQVTYTVLLGAVAFAGVGGTLNLGQSNYIRDKGFGMGAYIGRITSPLTGREEAQAATGYRFPLDEANLLRWRLWWRAAGLEHFLTFFLTCLFCLTLLTLIAYSLFYAADGTPVDGADAYGRGMGFVWGEALALQESGGPALRVLFLIMGVAILLTTELGVLDAASRISSDIIRVAWFNESHRWTESRLYYAFVWGTVALGTIFLLIGTNRIGGFGLFKLTASMNGGVMFVYSGLLLYMNRLRLPARVRIGLFRTCVLASAVMFFGYFTLATLYAVTSG